MNPYELILIMDPRLGEEKIGQQIAKVEEKIRSLGGEVEKTEKWGTKALASMMKKVRNLTQGYYVLINFKGKGALPAELKENLKVNEHIVRYFLSKAVIFETARAEEKEITGAPVAEAELAEIKGEPLGELK